MPKINKRGDSWYITVGSKRKSLGPISEGQAREALKLKEKEIALARMANVIDLPKVHTATFEELSKEYLRWHEQHYSFTSNDRIRGIFKNHFIPFFGKLQIDRIARTRAEAFKDLRLNAESPPKTATLNKELRQLQAYLNWCRKMEHIERSRLDGLSMLQENDSKPPRFYTAAELEKIYAHSRPRSGDEAKAKNGGRPINSSVGDYAPIWKVMANTGLRRAEALGLKWDWVSREHLRVMSSEASRTKSGKWRQVPLNQGAKASLEALAELYGRSGHVLPRVSPTSLTRAFSRSVRRAGLDGSLHCLRHTFCSHLAMQGIDIYTIKSLAGHSSVNTTQKYMHLSPTYLAGAVEELEL